MPPPPPPFPGAPYPAVGGFQVELVPDAGQGVHGSAEDWGGGGGANGGGVRQVTPIPLPPVAPPPPPGPAHL